MLLRGSENLTEHIRINRKIFDLQPQFTRRGFTSTVGQVTMFTLVLAFGVSLLFATVQVAMLNTVLIFLFVAFVGMQRCHATRNKLGDSRLRLLATFWLIKLGLTLFLLYVGWIPELNPDASSSWGYDPQRYYQDAYDLIERGWNPIAGSNYQGIIFYYGAIFYLFGHNPVIPALINAFVTLNGTLYLIRLAYEFKGERGPRDWTLAYLLLIPEVLWYDVMTSRETLVAVLVLVAVLSAGCYIVRTGTAKHVSTLLLSGSCFTAILAVRTTVAIPVAVSIAAIAILLSPSRILNTLPKLLVISLGIGLLAAGPLVQRLTGGVQVDYLKSIAVLQSFEANVASQHEWSQQSIGMLLAPNNWWQSILYLPPRMILYLLAPLPSIAVPIADLIAGSYFAWQNLMTIPSSVLNILALPYAMAGFAHVFKCRKQQPNPLILHLAFWGMFIGIAGGNIIIHERYRVMMSLLFFGCAWLGYTICTKAQIRRFAFIWYGLLCAGVVFYVARKVL